MRNIENKKLKNENRNKPRKERKITNRNMFSVAGKNTATYLP